MRLALTVLLALLPVAVSAAELEDTSAFDRAFAASFYTFDACGDAKYGVAFRDALDARFAQCPVTAAAREAHLRRNYWQAKKSHERMQKLIDDTGGMPARLPGMEVTCRQRQAEPDYVGAREKLDRFSEGAMKPEDVLPAACDADAITP